MVAPDDQPSAGAGHRVRPDGVGRKSPLDEISGSLKSQARSSGLQDRTITVGKMFRLPAWLPIATMTRSARRAPSAVEAATDRFAIMVSMALPPSEEEKRVAFDFKRVRLSDHGEGRIIELRSALTKRSSCTSGGKYQRLVALPGRTGTPTG